MVTFKDAERVLADALPGYESRPQQQALAAAVEEAMADGVHLIAEAGCGTGKSFGYLIPAIQSGKRVVVTTATKNLQDQIATGDLPFLQEHLGDEVPFTYAVLKGRSNYLCQAKHTDAQSRGAQEVAVHIKGIQGTGETWSGEREDLPFTVEDRDWRELTVSADECPGKRECPFGETCYAEKAKQKAKESDVVVVNHALFFTDLMVKKMTNGNSSMLDHYDIVVADEAHELEEWAANMLGQRFSEGSLKALTTEVRAFVSQFFSGDDPQASKVLDLGTVINGAMVPLWESLTPGRLYPKDFLENQDAWVDLANALGDYADAVSALSLDNATGDTTKAGRRKRLLVTKSINMAMKFADIIVAPATVLVRWVEEEPIKGARPGQPRTRKVIMTAPIEVADILDQLVWSKTPAVLVSATMSVGGSFDYIAGRLGIKDPRSLDVGTPFDYSKQAALYVPDDIPAPVKDKRAAWEGLSIERMRDLVNASDGRALLLFTSRKQMERAYAALVDRLDYTCLMQGMAGKSNKALAAEFMDDTHSVLFALKSFFTGVDFQGEACSLVVIDKLPFPVPDEPLTEARCDAIVNRGGDAFGDYTIPVMTLILQQGYGRLIRHRSDHGVVAILDPRLTKAGYGRKIMRSLPDAPLLTKVSEVEEFFEERAAA